MEESREAIAGDLGARPSEVVFTSGGTESDNLAVAGIFRAASPCGSGPPPDSAAGAPSITRCWTSPRRWWPRARSWIWLEVDDFGRVHADTLAAAIASRTRQTVALVTVMWANNEVGTVNPIRELAEVAHAHDIPMHTDAVQAVGQLPVDFAAMRRRRDDRHRRTRSAGRSASARCWPGASDGRADRHGGGQERGIRSGTLDVAGIVGFARRRVADAVAAPRRPSRPTCRAA